MSLYDSKTAKISVSKEAVLTGWRCPTSNMWCIPLVKCAITNDNTQTLLINEKFQPQDPRYTLLTNAQMHEQINAVTAAPTDTINNVYKLLSIERAVRYLHRAAVFPTKATWIKSIRNVPFLSWPLINVKMSTNNLPSLKKLKRAICVIYTKHSLHIKEHQEKEDWC